MIAQIDQACGTDAGLLCTFIFEQTESEQVASFFDQWLLVPVRVLVIIILAIVILQLLRFFIRTAVSSFTRSGAERLARNEDGATPVTIERALRRAETLIAVVQSLATVIVWVTALFFILNEFDISLAPLFAGAGVLGIVIGFGAQDVVADFLSGFFMLFEDQYGVGDVVDVGEVTGRVEDVSLRTTTIRDVSGTVWHIRNSEIKRVANKSQLWSRAVIDVSVAYDTDLRRAEGIIQRVADNLWHDTSFTKGSIIDAPEVWGVEALGADGISIRLVVKTDPAEQFAVARELRLRIKEALEEAGIEMPFQQRTVWLRQDDTYTKRDERPIVETAPIRSSSMTNEFSISEIADQADDQVNDE